MFTRRPMPQVNRVRVAVVAGTAASGGGGGATNHLLDDSGNVLAVTVAVDQLTNA